MRLRNSELWRRLMRPACCSAALLAVLAGCERDRNEDEPRETRGPRFPLPWNRSKDKKESITSQQKPENTNRNSRTLSVDEGEELPNPTEATRPAPVVNSSRNTQRQEPRYSNNTPTTNNHTGGSGDQAIFILAGLAQEHDRFKQHLKDMDTKYGEFLPVQQEQAKQIKQLTSISVPKLEQQMAAQQVESAKMLQGHTALEQRVVALEEELRQLKQHRTTPPLAASAPEIESTPDEPSHRLLPSPQVNPKHSATAQNDPKTPKTPTPVTIPNAPAEVKKVSRFSPQQQVIRTKVRGIYERVISDFPGTQQAFDALMSLGAMAEEDTDWPVAIKTYEQAATEFPNRPESVNARFHLGRVLAASGNYMQAREAFLIIPDWNPNHPMATSALLQAGVALAKAGKLDAGVRELRHIEKTQPDSTFAQDAREQIVALLYDGKRYDETLVCYPAVSDGARAGRKLELQLLKAQAERRAKKFKEATATLDALFKTQATPEVRASAKFEYADLMDEQSKTLDAARAFSDAAQEFPQNARTPEARMKAAQLFLTNELPDTAAEQMASLIKNLADRPVTEREQTEPEAMFILAKSQQSSGQMDASRKTLGDLRRKYPAHPRSLSADVEEARGMAERGAVKDATALLRNLIRNHPDAPQTAQAMLLLAELQERNTDKLQRANAYSDLLKQTAGSDDANTLELRRGLLLMELERSAEASAVFTQIADSNKAAPDMRLIARYQSAVAFQQSGQLDAAVVAYTQFLEGSTIPLDPAPKNLSTLVDDAKWKVEKLKWLKELTAPAAAPQGKAPAAPKAPVTPAQLPVLTPPPRTQTM